MAVTLEDHLLNLGDNSPQIQVSSLKALAHIYKYFGTPWKPSISQKILDALLAILKSPDCPETELILLFLNDIIQRDDTWILMSTSKVREIVELLRTLENTTVNDDIVTKVKKLQTVLLAQHASRASDPGERGSLLQREECMPVLHLPWVVLVKCDSFVMRTLENAWNQNHSETELVNLCQLTNEMVLKDFPGEIFLQRASILNALFHTVDETISSNVRGAILQLLMAMTTNISTRIAEAVNPRFTNFLSKENIITNNENSLQGTVYQKYQNTYPDFYSNCEPQIKFRMTQMIDEFDDTRNFLFENSEASRGKRVSLAEFCMECMERAIEHDYMELAEALLTFWNELHVNDLWRCTDPIAVKIRTCLLKSFSALGRSLKMKRAWFQERSDAEEKYITKLRQEYLFTLSFTVATLKTTIPMGQECSVLHGELQDILIESTHDYGVMAFFTDIFQTLHQYCSSFGSVQKEKVINLEILLSVCKGMEYSIKLVGSSEETPSINTLTMITTCIQSLQITHYWALIKWVVKLSLNSHKWIMDIERKKMKLREIILLLMSHSNPDVRREMFQTSYDELKLLLSGEESSQNLEKMSDFLEEDILRAIINEGFADERTSQCALGIVVWISKQWECRYGQKAELVLDKLLPVFPYLQCIMDLSPFLLMNVVEILEPVQAIQQLPQLDVLKGNIRMLFTAKDDRIKELSVNRIILIVTRVLWQKCDTGTITYENVSEAFRTSPGVNLSSLIYTMSEIDSKLVNDVLGILERDEEPQEVHEIALRSLGTILRNWRNYEVFLSRGGLKIVSNMLEKVLIKKEAKFQDKLAIQVIGVLKLICINSLIARIELFFQETIICYIIAAMSNYVTIQDLCQDARIVLGLLVFQDMLTINIQERSGIRNKCLIILPERLLKLLSLPFICSVHDQLRSENDLPEMLMKSELYCAPLRQCWAVNLFDINCLVEMTYTDYELSYQGPQYLKLTPLDLMVLRASFVPGMYKLINNEIQNASNHAVVKESIQILNDYMSLQTLNCGNFHGNMTVWATLPWEEKLKPFFSVRPTNEKDLELLLVMVKFINSTICKQLTEDVLKPIDWLVSILKSPHAPLTTLLKLNDETEFELWGELLSLIKHICSAHSDVKYEGNGSSWCYIMNSMLDNIETLLSAELVDLELLYTVLPCLTAITSMNGWSSGFPNLYQLCNRFVVLIQDLLQKFIWQRMPEGFKASFICSQIAKNSALCLKNIVRELVQLWNDETPPTVVCYALGGEESLTILNVTSVKDLTVCRDVIVRSSAFEALATLCSCSPARIALAETFGGTFLPLLELALRSLLDRYEADAVRCGAAQLIVNLLRKILEQDRLLVYAQYEQFITLLQSPDFYKEVCIIAEQLCFAEIVFWDFEKGCLDMNASKKYCYTFSIEGTPLKSSTEPTTSPILLRYVCIMIKMIIMWDCGQILQHLEECDVVFALYKSMQVFPCSYGSTSSVLYGHTLEMCIEICNLLSLHLQKRDDFISTAGGIYQCMESIGFLLEPFLYSADSARALILRNELWASLFELIINVIRSHEGFHMFMNVISGCKYHGNFYEAIRFAMSSNSPQLVKKALDTLSAFLEHISSSVPEASSTVLDEQKTIRCRDCPKDAQPDYLFNMGVMRLINSSLTMTDVLCEQTEKIFRMKFEETKSSFVIKSELLICLTNLCVISDEALKLCVESNVTEILLLEITRIHKFLEGQSSMDSFSSKRGIKGLKLILSMLGNLLKHPEAKKRARHNGFSQQVALIWPLLSSSTELRNLTLKAVCNYSVNFREGLESLLETGPTSHINVLQSTFYLLLEEMEEVSKHLPEYDMTCAYYSSKVLENSLHLSRCRSFIRRCFQNFDLDSLITRIIKCRKGGFELVKYLLEFLCKFTCYPEGQQAFLQVQDIIELLMTLLQNPDRQVKELSLIILGNLTTVEKIKSAVMTEKNLKVFQSIMKRGSIEEKFAVLFVVGNLIENSTSRKHIFKEYNFPKYIEEFAVYLSCNLEDQENVQKLKVVDRIINEFL